MSYSSSCHHSPPPSSLTPTKSRMETFWYWLTQVDLAIWPFEWRESVCLILLLRWHTDSSIKERQSMVLDIAPINDVQ